MYDILIDKHLVYVILLISCYIVKNFYKQYQIGMHVTPESRFYNNLRYIYVNDTKETKIRLMEWLRF